MKNIMTFFAISMVYSSLTAFAGENSSSTKDASCCETCMAKNAAYAATHANCPTRQVVEKRVIGGSGSKRGRSSKVMGQ